MRTVRPAEIKDFSAIDLSKGAKGCARCAVLPSGNRIASFSKRLLTDLHQTITRLDVVLVWLEVASCRV